MCNKYETRVFLLIEFKTIAVSAVLIIERKFRPFFITGSSGGYTQLPGLFTGFVRLKGKSPWRSSELCPEKQIVRHKKNDDKRSPTVLVLTPSYLLPTLNVTVQMQWPIQHGSISYFINEADHNSLKHFSLPLSWRLSRITIFYHKASVINTVKPLIMFNKSTVE